MNTAVQDDVFFREMSQKAKTILNSLFLENEELAKRSRGVNKLALLLAENMKQLDNQAVACLHAGALLLDIGKIGMPATLFSKPEPLLDKELDHLKKHPIYGYCAARMIGMPKDVADIILHHHERFDGKGYPYGLRGNAIPLLARICTVADGLYSIISDQAYRDKLTYEEAFNQLELNRGTQFDPDIVDLCIELSPRIQMEESCAENPDLMCNIFSQVTLYV